MEDLEADQVTETVQEAALETVLVQVQIQVAVPAPDLQQSLTQDPTERQRFIIGALCNFYGTLSSLRLESSHISYPFLVILSKFVSRSVYVSLTFGFFYIIKCLLIFFAPMTQQIEQNSNRVILVDN